MLTWALKRMASTIPCSPLVVLVHSHSDQEKCAGLLCTRTTTIFRSRFKTLLRALVDLANHIDSSEVGVFGIEMSLCPKDLLNRVYAHHAAGHFHHTHVTGFPRNSTPSIYNKELLVLMGRSSLPLEIEDPAAAISYFQHIRGIPLSVGIFNALEEYQLGPSQIPESIALSTPHDVEMLGHIINKFRDDTSPGAAFNYFKGWKALTINSAREILALSRRMNLKPSAVKNRQRRKRVFFMSFAAAISGVELSVCSLIKGLDRARFEPFIFVPLESAYTDRLRGVGSEVICPDRLLHFNSVLSSLIIIEAMMRVRPHILHLNAQADLATILVAKLMGVRVIHHVRVGEVSHLAEQLRVADAVIANSEFIKRRIAFLSLPHDNIHVVYPGIDTQFFYPGVIPKEAARKIIRLPKKSLAVAMVARFSPMKRHDLMIEACQVLRNHFPNFRLILASDTGSMENAWFDRIQELVNQRDLGNTVSILPFCHDVRNVYAAADLAVLPAEGEGIGRCVIEAMAMGVPVIVTDYGGPCEIVVNRETGRVVTRGSRDELVAAMREMLSDRKLCRAFSTKARTFIENNLSEEGCARKIMSIYDQVYRETQ